MNRDKRRWGIAMAGCILWAATLAAQKPAGESVPVATLDGAPITEKDLKIREQLIRLEQQAYQLRLRALESVILEKLLEKEAAARKLSIERFRKELEAMPPENRQAYLAKLRGRATVEILLEAPRAPVDAGRSPRRGAAAAPVTIVEFSDFQCPFCKRAKPTLRQVQEKYGNRVSFVYKDLPLLSIHPEAQPAAEAARCAGEQGKFWEFHDALFAEARLTKDSYGPIANKLGLNAEALQKCRDSGRHRAAVQADLEQARKLGAQATPTFFINGIMLEGAQPLEAFTQIIDSELVSRKDAKSR